MIKRRFIAYSISLTYCIIMLFVWMLYFSELFGTHVNYQNQNLGILISQVLVLGGALIAFALIDRNDEYKEIHRNKNAQSTASIRKSISQYGVLLIITVILLLIMFSFREFFGNMVYFFTKRSVYLPTSNETEKKTIAQLLMTLTSVGIITPIFEELFFRGLIIGKFTNIPAFLSCGFSLCSFLLMHNNVEQVVYIFPMALVCCLIYIRTMNIAFPIFIHMFVNIFGIFNTFTNEWIFSLDKAIEEQSSYIAGINCAGLLMVIALLIIVLSVMLKLFYSRIEMNIICTKAEKKEITIYVILGLVFLVAMCWRILIVYSPYDVSNVEIPYIN